MAPDASLVACTIKYHKNDRVKLFDTETCDGAGKSCTLKGESGSANLEDCGGTNIRDQAKVLCVRAGYTAEVCDGGESAPGGDCWGGGAVEAFAAADATAKWQCWGLWGADRGGLRDMADGVKWYQSAPTPASTSTQPAADAGVDEDHELVAHTQAAPELDGGEAALADFEEEVDAELADISAEAGAAQLAAAAADPAPDALA